MMIKSKFSSLFCAAALFMCCCSPSDPLPDMNHLANFHRAYLISQDDAIEERNLYVDYSTSITDGMKPETMSRFYMDVVPS